MRHRRRGKHLGRDTKHRKALLRNLARSMVETGGITTTETKAKETRRILDKLVSTAKRGDLNSRRQLHRFFGRRDVVNTLVDRVAPVFKSRQSGFTTLRRMGIRRGDTARMVRLEWVEEVMSGSLKPLKKKVSKPAKKTAKKTAKSAKPKAEKSAKAIKKTKKATAKKPVARKKVTASKAAPRKAAPKKTSMKNK